MNADFINDNFQYVEYILVNEKTENEIFADKELTEPIGNVRDYNNKIVKVVSQYTDGDLKHVLVEYKEVLVGWFLFETSMPLFNKKNEKIEVEYESFYSPEINSLINKNGDYNLYFQRYQVFSRFFAYHNGQLLEAIFRKNTFVAFAPSEVIDRLRVVNTVAQLKHKDTELYATSKMDEKILMNKLDRESEVKVQSFFPRLKRAKIKQGPVTGWVKTEDLTDFDYNETAEQDFSQQHILQQHIEIRYANEQTEIKTIMMKLLNENIALEKKLLKQRELTKKVTQRYANLRNSKLGKMQLLIWDKRAKRGRK
ncbi:hypothetical protein [Macrococcus carouselicus]|uniref:Uncharacterized protein n=1 Tax=Macrococcus carouselicus TaxID=69969 RepID=A0A9Q8FR88_9STAP|nr:hypothetical protein [Macrococcus carouselicus]TDM03829.1 hypothetical protein ERX40_01305 [Macrococcus carouselicus]